MAKFPGRLQEKSHPVRGINRDPVTEQGIRVKQAIWDDYSSAVKHKNLLFSLALVAVRLFVLLSPFSLVSLAGWGWQMPSPSSQPQHPLGSGRRVRAADKAFDTLQW